MDIFEHSTLKMRAALLQMPAARLKLLISELQLLQLLVILDIARRRVVAIHTQSHSCGRRSPAQLEATSTLLLRIVVVHVICALLAVVGRRST